VIQEAEKAYPTRQVCAATDVPHSSYYAWKKRRKVVDVERLVLRSEIRTIHRETDKSYGSRRMAKEMRRRGFAMGRYQAKALMKEANVVALVPKPPKYPRGGEAAVVAPNLLERKFDVDRPNAVWAGDITYIWTQKGWLYLAVVIDLFSRRVVGWAFSGTPDTAFTLRALRLALAARRPPPGLMFHSDQGCQYTSAAFRDFLAASQIVQSMSRRGNCWDNAVVERFFRSLKTERVRTKAYRNHAEAQADLTDYIAVFYNQQRLHSAANSLPPAEYEALWLKTS
jgi:putative transposase